jgi:hypothetical protein
MSLRRIPASLSVAVLAGAALSLGACAAPSPPPECPPEGACRDQFRRGPDGSLIPQAIYTDGGLVDDARCPPLPPGCAVA